MVILSLNSTCLPKNIILFCKRRLIRTKQNVIDPLGARHVVYLGDGEFCIWKILNHSKWDTKRRLGTKIFGHNLVRLHHIDSGSFLSSGTSFEGAVPEISLRRYYGSHTEENQSVKHFITTRSTQYGRLPTSAKSFKDMNLTQKQETNPTKSY
jgi:hypothetical protein